MYTILFNKEFMEMTVFVLEVPCPFFLSHIQVLAFYYSVWWRPYVPQ